MTNKELRKLRRSDLLELLVSLSEENDLLKEQLKKAQKEIASKEVMLEDTGSLAEASLKLSGVFQAAENAASIYLENLEALVKRQVELTVQTESELNSEAQKKLERVDQECIRLKEKTQKQCRSMLESAARRIREIENEDMSVLTRRGG